VIDLYKPLEYK